MREGDIGAMPPELQLAQLQALDRVMAMAEFGLDGSLHRANDNYLQLMGFTREQSLGRPHRSFCSARLADSARYREIWTHLCAGNATPAWWSDYAAMAAVAGWRLPIHR